MRSFRLPVLLLTILLTALGTQGQSAPETSPTPPAKRRGLDQFDIGINVPRATIRTKPDEYAADESVSERVSGHLFELIARLNDNVEVFESEYKQGAGQNVDPEYRYSPERILHRNLVGTYRVIEVHRVGLLGQEAVKHPANLALLKANQRIIEEILALIEDAGGTQSGTKLRTLSDRYLGPQEPDAKVNKRELISAMLGSVSANFAKLKRRIVPVEGSL